MLKSFQETPICAQDRLQNVIHVSRISKKNLVTVQMTLFYYFGDENQQFGSRGTPDRVVVREK